MDALFIRQEALLRQLPQSLPRFQQAVRHLPQEALRLLFRAIIRQPARGLPPPSI